MYLLTDSLLLRGATHLLHTLVKEDEALVFQTHGLICTVWDATLSSNGRLWLLLCSSWSPKGSSSEKVEIKVLTLNDRCIATICTGQPYTCTVVPCRVCNCVSPLNIIRTFLLTMCISQRKHRQWWFSLLTVGGMTPRLLGKPKLV